jgi:phosphoglycerate dehydrogenase-like enzyme
VRPWLSCCMSAARHFQPLGRDCRSARVVGLCGAGGRQPGAARHRQPLQLLPVVDVLSLHLPLTPETTGMIDAAAFAAMKRGGVLINTARGPLVDGAALFEALTSGHLRGAART